MNETLKNLGLNNSNTHPKDEIDDLVQRLREANTAYHDKDSPIIPDADFDRLKLELIKLEKQYPELKHANSPTEKVGGSTARGFKKSKA